MALKKGDFIEINFTGKTKEGEVFDSTLKQELEKLHQGHSHEIKAEPFVFSLGHGMFLQAVDDFLMGKELGKEYKIELTPEKAFGVRQRELVQTIPMKIFREKNINPVQGATLNFDGRAGKILTVSGGRVMVDFNHPLAGKEISYDINILKKISGTIEKIQALNKFFFGRDFKTEIKDNKIILHVEKAFSKLAELFKDKYKEILGMEFEIKETEEKESGKERKKS